MRAANQKRVESSLDLKVLEELRLSGVLQRVRLQNFPDREWRVAVGFSKNSSVGKCVFGLRSQNTNSCLVYNFELSVEDTEKVWYDRRYRDENWHGFKSNGENWKPSGTFSLCSY